jgi:hypothetical protein
VPAEWVLVRVFFQIVDYCFVIVSSVGKKKKEDSGFLF